MSSSFVFFVVVPVYLHSASSAYQSASPVSLAERCAWFVCAKNRLDSLMTASNRTLFLTPLVDAVGDQTRGHEGLPTGYLLVVKAEQCRRSER